MPQRLVERGKLPSAFKVQWPPSKKKNGPPADSEAAATNGKDEILRDPKNAKAQKPIESPSNRSPRSKAQNKGDLSQFDEIVQRTSVPSKSQAKADRALLGDDTAAQNNR